MASASYLHRLPVYLSTGMSTLGEVESALQIFTKKGVTRDMITTLHCLSACSV